MALDEKLKRVETFDGKEFEMVFPTCYFSSIVKEKSGNNNIEKALIYRADQVEVIEGTGREDGEIISLKRTIYSYDDLFADAEKIDEFLLTEDKITGTKEDKYTYVSNDSDKVSSIVTYKDDVAVQEIDFAYLNDGKISQSVYSIENGNKYLIYESLADENDNELLSTQYTYINKDGKDESHILKHVEIQEQENSYVYIMDVYDKVEDENAEESFRLMYTGRAEYSKKEDTDLKYIKSFPLLRSIETFPAENREVEVEVKYNEKDLPVSYTTTSTIRFDDINKTSKHTTVDECFYNENDKLEHIESNGITISTIKYYDKYREIIETNDADDNVNESHEVIYRFDNDNEEIYEKYIPAIDRYEYNLSNGVAKAVAGKIEGCRFTNDGVTYETYFKVDTYMSSIEKRDEYDITVYSKKIRALSNQVHNYIIHKLKDSIDFKIGESMFKKYM